MCPSRPQETCHKRLNPETPECPWSVGVGTSRSPWQHVSVFLFGVSTLGGKGGKGGSGSRPLLSAT
eukprot:9496166-Pyramimonas_sp.AAC.1